MKERGALPKSVKVRGVKDEREIEKFGQEV